MKKAHSSCTCDNNDNILDFDHLKRYTKLSLTAHKKMSNFFWLQALAYHTYRI